MNLFLNELKFIIWEIEVAVTHINKRSFGASAVFKSVIKRYEKHS